MRLLILTADQKTLTWPSLPQKLTAIKTPLKVWDIEITAVKDITPLVSDDGYITHTWLHSLYSPYYGKGYDLVALHFTESQKKKWKIKKGLRGSNPFGITGFYFWADEDTKRMGLNQFVQDCLHELSHEYFQQTKLPDVVDVYHKKHANIQPLVESFQWEKYPTRSALYKKEVTYLQKLVASLKEAVNPPNKGLLPLVERQANKMVEDMNFLGLPVRITQGYRSIAEQNKLYAQGRTTPGAIVTNAKGGESYHNYGVAVDFVFRKEGYDVPESYWKTLATVGKKYGFLWGGDWPRFKDRPHFEMTLGYELKDFKNNKVDYKKYV